MRFRNSLTSRYLLIVLIAMIFMPIVFPLAAGFYWLVNDQLRITTPSVMYPSGDLLKKRWHKEAASLSGMKAEMINERLQQFKREYPETSIFWVDGESRTRLKLPENLEVPEQWSALRTVAFMKNSIDSDPFTVVAYIGGKEPTGQGFMVLQLPRSFLNNSDEVTSKGAIFTLFLVAMLLSFILVSWLFFARIRKRLLHLGKAMTSSGDNGIPEPVILRKPDEIGELEAAYNDMVAQLVEGRRREKEEEELRKSLISSLSHDLRTPLTIIRSHIFSMEQEPLTEKGKASLSLMESKIGDLGGLIDNLLSYSLLTSGRVQLASEPRDVARLVRESAAAWYAVWEKEGIEADIDLGEEPLIWKVDVLWFKRILDNLFQNVVRHAKAGGYIGIHRRERQGEAPALVISDKGPGMEGETPAKGAGIGLAVVDVLTKEMGIRYSVDTSAEGTFITLSLK